MVTTGYSDTLNRTVSNGFGTATSGQAYSLNGTASDFSVAPSTGSILPSATGDRFAFIDLATADVDMQALVALSALPATNQSLIGFVTKYSNSSNYYSAALVVTTAGAASIRFYKHVGGVLTTIATATITGVTIVAGTFYNLRHSCYWSQALQTNVMSIKFWAVGTTEPGGWTATTTDAGLTQYTSGTSIGLMARDEAAAVGAVTFRFQTPSSRSYNLPMPATTDPMCYDPAVAYPKQTVLQSLAAAADATVATFDPLSALAGLFPRVRVSVSNLAVSTAPIFVVLTWSTTEFNVGTSTDLSLDSQSIYLPTGIWLVMGEIRIAEAPSDYIYTNIGSSDTSGGFAYADFRSNAAQLNDQGVGGTAHVQKTVISSNPTTPVRCFLPFNANNIATTYTVVYAALTAIKISDYFA